MHNGISQVEDSDPVKYGQSTARSTPILSLGRGASCEEGPKCAAAAGAGNAVAPVDATFPWKLHEIAWFVFYRILFFMVKEHV